MPALPISASSSLRIEDVHFNGGFGRAAPLAAAEVLASREGEAALCEAEERLLAEANALGAATLARLAGHKAGSAAGAGGRSGSTPRGSISRPAAAPPAPSSLRPRRIRRNGGRVSRSCSQPAEGRESRRGPKRELKRQ